MKNKNFRSLLLLTLNCMLIIGMIMTSTTLNLHSFSEKSINLNINPLAQYTDTNIVINGDSDFITQAGINGWTGLGTIESPYVIANKNINATSNNGIYIRNLNTVHFRLENISIVNGSTGNFDGIMLERIKSSAVLNNITLENNLNGLVLYYLSKNIMIMNSSFILNENYGIYIIDGSENNTFVNNIMAFNQKSGVFIDYSNYNDFISNLIHNNSECGIHTDSANGNEFITNIIINNTQTGLNITFESNSNIINENLIQNNNVSGIFVYKSDNNNISKNIIQNNKYYGIELKESVGNILQNNTIQNHGLSGIYASILSDSTKFQYNIIQNNAEYGIYVIDSNLNQLYNNTIQYNMLDGIYIDEVTGFNITNNFINGNTGCGLLIYNSNNNYVRYNNINNNIDNGIAIYNSITNIFEYNNLTSNYNGFILYNAYSNILRFNHVKTHSQDGFYLRLSTNNTIISNNISYNIRYGIRNIQYSHNNTISLNIINYNQQSGVFIYSSNFIVVTYNIIQFNILTALEIGDSINNTIYYNNGTTPDSLILSSNVIGFSSTGNITLFINNFGIVHNFTIYQNNGIIANQVQLLTNNTWKVNNLNSGNYSFYVISRNNYGQTVSNIIYCEVQRLPTNFSLQSNLTSIGNSVPFRLNWTISNHAILYIIYLNNNPIQVLSIINTTSIEQIITTNGTYVYYIMAYNQFGQVKSNEIIVTIGITTINTDEIDNNDTDDELPDNSSNNTIWWIAGGIISVGSILCIGLLYYFINNKGNPVVSKSTKDKYKIRK